METLPLAKAGLHLPGLLKTHSHKLLVWWFQAMIWGPGFPQGCLRGCEEAGDPIPKRVTVMCQTVEQGLALLKVGLPFTRCWEKEEENLVLWVPCPRALLNQPFWMAGWETGEMGEDEGNKNTIWPSRQVWLLEKVERRRSQELPCGAGD